MINWRDGKRGLIRNPGDSMHCNEVKDRVRGEWKFVLIYDGAGNDTQTENELLRYV